MAEWAKLAADALWMAVVLVLWAAQFGDMAARLWGG